MNDPYLLIIKEHVYSCLARVRQIIRDIEYDFTFEELTIRYSGKLRMLKYRADVYRAFDRTIKELRERSKIGTAQTYHYAKYSFRNFSKELYFKDVTVSFLERYERWMIENKISLTTIGIYTRCMRAVIRKAILTNRIPHEKYPFGKQRDNRYEIPESNNCKKAVDEKYLRKILDYEPESEIQEFALDMWRLSFFCNGMNLADILNLRRSHIKDGIMTFYSPKTSNTRRKQYPIIINVTKTIKVLINKWANKTKTSNSFLFDIFNDQMTEEEKFVTRRDLCRKIDKALNRVVKELNLDVQLNFSSARHTWATMMQNEGASINYISKGLGHTTILTTQRYLAQFPNQTIIEAGAILEYRTQQLRGI